MACGRGGIQARPFGRAASRQPDICGTRDKGTNADS